MVGELVSIVMATYNGEKYLRQQLDSILHQTYQHIELIVVDDASTDETLSILNEYAALDYRIHVFPAEKNFGLVANFERGLKLAKGDFIALSDQDDIFRKDKIELLLTTLKNHPGRDLVVSDLSLIDEEGNQVAPSMWRYSKIKPKQGRPFRRLLYANFATGCAMMFRRRLLQIALPFPPKCLVHDWWLAVVATTSKGGGICILKEQLTAYRQHRSNVLGASAANNLNVKGIISRIKAVPRGASNFGKRMCLYKILHLDRLDGYLQSSVWSPNELILVEQSRKVFIDYMSDTRCNLFSRITKLPPRLRYAFITGGAASCLAVVMHTISPYK
jgi:glycosyltransferase involved in cell wall biosynthesis